jgi:hypothetical protein
MTKQPRHRTPGKPGRPGAKLAKLAAEGRVGCRGRRAAASSRHPKFHAAKRARRMNEFSDGQYFGISFACELFPEPSANEAIAISSRPHCYAGFHAGLREWRDADEATRAELIEALPNRFTR